MVATSTPGPAATGPPSAFEAVVQCHGTGALLRFLGALLVWSALHVLLRLPLMVALRMCEALMARVDTPAAAGFPGRPTTPTAYGGATA